MRIWRWIIGAGRKGSDERLVRLSACLGRLETRGDGLVIDSGVSRARGGLWGLLSPVADCPWK